MRTRDDIEAYLVRSGLSHEEVSDGTWMVRSEDAPEPIIVRWEGPLVLVRTNVGPAPSSGREDAFARLLHANAEALVHCAYGLEGDTVILSRALPLENLDYNEFVSTLDDMTLALARDRDAAMARR